MIRVALIEDLDNYRNAMQILLNGSTGFQCVAAWNNAEKAIKEFLTVEFDVALIDINLPGINGIEFVRFIRKEDPHALCMICTAYDEDEKVFKALEAGAHAYILKSMPPAKILDAIVELVEGGSPMSNEIARKVVMAFNKKQDPQMLQLSARENEILTMLAQGLLYKEIAAKINISIETVKRHCFNIYQKLHVSNRSEAISKYHKHQNPL